MIVTRRYASVTGVMALLVALTSMGVELKAKTTKVIVYDVVRATKYHKTDYKCDHWTLRGETSTRLKLPQCDDVVTDPNTIGNVALDPTQVPEGSLVYETQTGRFFVATTGGEAVIRRDAAKQLARLEKLPSEFKNALVFDFYYPQEIVSNHFTSCWVIPHEGEKEFRRLWPEYQEQRLYASFWLARLSRIYDSTSNEAEKQKLREMMNRLRVIDYQMVSR